MVFLVLRVLMEHQVQQVQMEPPAQQAQMEPPAQQVQKVQQVLMEPMGHLAAQQVQMELLGNRLSRSRSRSSSKTTHLHALSLHQT